MYALHRNHDAKIDDYAALVDTIIDEANWMQSGLVLRRFEFRDLVTPCEYEAVMEELQARQGRDDLKSAPKDSRRNGRRRRNRAARSE